MNGVFQLPGQIPTLTVNPTFAFSPEALKIPAGMAINAATTTDLAASTNEVEDLFAGQVEGVDLQAILTAMMISSGNQALGRSLFANAADTAPLKPYTLNPEPAAKFLLDARKPAAAATIASVSIVPTVSGMTTAEVAFRQDRDLRMEWSMYEPNTHNSQLYDLFLARAKPIPKMVTLQDIVYNGVRAIPNDVASTKHSLRRFLADSSESTGVSGRGLLTWRNEARANKIARGRMIDAIEWANEYLPEGKKLKAAKGDDELVDTYLKAAFLMRFLMALSLSYPSDHERRWVIDNMNDSLGYAKYNDPESYLQIDDKRFAILFPAFYEDFTNAKIDTSWDSQRLAHMQVRLVKLADNIPAFLDLLSANTNSGALYFTVFAADAMNRREIDPPPIASAAREMIPLFDALPSNTRSENKQTVATALGKYIYLATTTALGGNISPDATRKLTQEELYVMQAIAESRVSKIIVGLLQELGFTTWALENGGVVDTVKHEIRARVEEDIDLQRMLTREENERLNAWLNR